MTIETQKRPVFYRWSLATLSWYIWLVVFGLMMFVPEVHPSSEIMGIWLIVTTVARAFGY